MLGFGAVDIEAVDGRVEDLLDGLCNEQAALRVALLVALLALRPIILVKSRCAPPAGGRASQRGTILRP